LAAIHQGFPLDERFKNKDPKTNATVRAWIVACPSETCWMNERSKIIQMKLQDIVDRLLS
jgi:hypothetical protein